jgi:GDP-L-fucose synthase
MKILLTGGRGMVGRNILENELRHDYEILAPSSLELNLLDNHAIERFLIQQKPDMVVHAAGVVGGIQANINDPVRFLVDNMQMSFNIIMGCRNLKIQRFLNLASSCMYPTDAVNPLSEDYILKGALEPTNEGYALAKVASTRLCEYISREDKALLYKTAIPCNLYGRYDNFDLTFSHMIPAVINKIQRGKTHASESIDIWGDGQARREFMHVADFADFVFYAIKNFEKMPQNLNVGLGHDYTINDYYQKIAEVIGYAGSMKHDLTKPTGMQQKLLDVSKLRSFGWQHQSSLDEGLRVTYKYYLEEVKK